MNVLADQLESVSVLAGFNNSHWPLNTSYTHIIPITIQRIQQMSIKYNNSYYYMIKILRTDSANLPRWQNYTLIRAGCTHDKRH